MIAYSVYVQYWGTGLNAVQNLHTNPMAWPGDNKMGKIMHKVAEKLRNAPSNAWSCQKSTSSTNKKNPQSTRLNWLSRKIKLM